MKLLRLLVAAWSVLPFLAQGAPPQPPPKAVEPPPVEMLADAPFLQPSSTLEFRFARPMVSRDEIGLSPAQAPITISPAVPGNYTWLSRSSGVFVPSSAWPLGGQFTATLAPGAKSADGKPLTGAFRATLRTPAFARTAMRGDSDDDVAPPLPKVMLAFNLAVELAKAEELFQFVDSGGRKMAAKVRYGTRSDYFSLKPEDEDWDERWRLAKEGPKAPSAGEDEDEEEMSAPDPESAPPLPNRLVITPVSALTSGGVWRLEMKRGLKSKTGLKIGDPLVVPLGSVRPFVISTLQPANYINSGRNLMIEFSHNLAPDITPETAAKFFRIEPAVPNLRFDGWSSSLTAHGDFELGREYRLEVDPAVISEDGLPFQGNRRSPFRFAPVAPRLYLPAITGHQIRSGQRKFEAVSANLKAIKVTAQVVAAADAAASVKAFDKYRLESSDSDEQYQPLPPGLIRGKKIFERSIDLPTGAVDAKQTTALSWDEILGVQKAGVIFLTLEGQPAAGVAGKRPGAQALIQLTDIGVLWKKVAEGLRVTAFSMATGRPLEGAGIALLNGQFAETGRGKTDAQGTATVALAPELSWMVVTLGEDVHALGMGPNEGKELPMSAFRVPIDYSSWEAEAEKSLALRALIFTDRPLYRPGEMVHVKGYVRDTAGSTLTARAGLKGILKLRDMRSNEISDTEVTTNAVGAFDVDLELKDAGRGTYSLALEFPDAPGSRWQRGFNCRFEVADFQPNAFEINLPLASRLAPGAEVDAKVTAKYLFGAPLTSADARWTLRYLRETFAPEGFSEWHFGEEDNSEGKILTLHGDGRFAGAEGFSIRPKLPEVKDAPFKGVLTVEVTDINQQTVSESRLFVRDAADFYLGLAVPEGAVFRPGDEIAGRAIAIRPDGKPMPQPVEVSAELVQVRFETVRVQGAGKAISFRSEKVEEVVGKATGRTLLPNRVNEGWQVADGATVKFKPTKAGQYRLRMTAKDAGGRAITSELQVFVTGADEVAWDYHNPAQVDLVADKPEYRPGETARLLVKTPISGDALVTVERENRILRTMQVKLEGNAPAIEVPLEKTDGPNVFVSMVLIRGREQSTRKFKTPEYRYGLTMLRVSDPVRHLQVEVAPTRETVEPGDEVATDVVVRDGAGQPVGNAEVTFFAVDDGILALTGYERPAPQPIFDAPFSLSVRTGLTLFDLLPEAPTDLEFANKGYLIGGGGLEGPGLKVRRDFPGTACWFPALKTDAAGKVRVRFPAPDAVTRYRLVAVAQAGVGMFGSGESAFAIRKPFMVMSALGQIGNVGDELIARAVVRNDTGADATAEVSLQLDRTAEPVKPGADGNKARVAVKNGESKSVDLPVRLTAMGKAEWTWSARLESGGKKFEDHVAAPLLVGSSAPVLHETYITELSAPSSDLLAGVNPQLLDGTGTVTVTVANTRLAELRESANHLLEYPYGCAEQTCSSLIPWALLPELKAVMPDLAKNEAQADEAIRKGLDRLFAMQTGGGGLSYWPGGNYPSLFASAYGAITCRILAGRGVELPSGHEALLKYLSEELRGVGRIRDEQQLADRVLAVYALAASQHAEPAYHEELFRRRKELSYESRALLALALLESGGPSKMVDDLLSTRTATPDTFSWFGGAARERAIQLFAWSVHSPKSPEVGRLTKELLAYRKNGHWGTTQQNAWALIALTRYYTAAEDGGKPVKGTLVRRGGELPFHVTKEQPSLTESVVFAPTEPLAPVAVKNPNKGTLFGETRFVVRPPLADQPRQDRGYAVSRSFHKLTDDGSLAEATDLKVGDRILVSLRVETTRPGHFVAIDDPLPAILEAVNPAFQNQKVGGVEAGARDWVSDYREIRADRVLYFCDHLPAGAFTFRYLARVRSAGKATAGQTKVEEMYRPERFGLGASAALSSRVAEAK